MPLLHQDVTKYGKHTKHLKTKHDEINESNIPGDMESNFHTQAIEPYNRPIHGNR
ncbi:hypothetical protein FACI_IFERC00001G0644 [Ferroplasma acidarmanus Fer1]|uniref:Uncharacterized protein n=1 Tax=Ferroplasma acidarmanus Fer1 TaxID=333146 RepID=S0AR49_FERAC|nr:hypothetical protein FACI_IFERC00001G0644 [Ferroplasma acidarmanus Fer1]